MDFDALQPQQRPAREDLSEYVAHLQQHMSLQAKNLVPALTQVQNSRDAFLHETQATFEKHVSRQTSQS